MVPVEVARADVLVIGGGGAGAQAAIAAARAGCSVLLLEKGIFGRSGCTVMGAFSCCAAFGHADRRDNPAVHFEDTLTAGRGMNAPDLLDVFTREAPGRVQDLYEMGVPFARDGDKFAQARMDGHTYARACFIDYFHTGRGMLLGLRQTARKTPGIRSLSEHLVLSLLCADGRVWGALALNLSSMQPLMVFAGATIVATGGGSQVYLHSTVSADNTGDGLSLALAAGATLRDMEFVQFYPTVTLYPRLVGLDPTAPATLRLQVSARIFNSRGEDFIDRVLPGWRFKGTRDFMARTIYSEIMRGGAASPHGGVFIDVSHLPGEEIERELGVDGFYQRLLAQGIDLKKGPIETTVAAHYFMGGIRVDTDGWSGVSGLYAAGEAVAGYHGANRLAGNALSEILVSGHRAGLGAAKEAPGASRRIEPGPEQFADVWQQNARFLREGSPGPAPSEVKMALRHVMWEKVGVIRECSQLERAWLDLNSLADTVNQGMSMRYAGPYSREVLDAFEVLHMLTVARAIVLAALMRRESRGAHFRADYPDEDQVWSKNIDINMPQSSGLPVNARLAASVEPGVGSSESCRGEYVPDSPCRTVLAPPRTMDEEQPVRPAAGDWALVEIERTSASAPPHYDTYQVPYDPGLTLMDVLQHIYLRLDPTLAFRHACDCSYCGVCAVRLNGKPVLACETMMTKHMRVEPLSKPASRDLITQPHGGHSSQ